MKKVNLGYNTYEMPITSDQRQSALEKAMKCYGSAYVFEQKAKCLRFKLRILAFLGIAVPVLVGLIAMSFTTEQKKLGIIITFASIISIFQLIVSVWALVADWNNKLSEYMESKCVNYRLADLFGALSKNTTISEELFNLQITEYNTEDKIRSDFDNRNDISTSEKRKGMRIALWKYQIQCAVCGRIPKSADDESDCGTCGK